MKTKLQLVILAFALIATGSLSAQEIPDTEEAGPKVKPFRIGAKIGFPNLIGGGVEYVTPLFGDRLAVAFDFSSLSESSVENFVDLDGDEIKMDYWEAGLNYYLFKPGRGLYLGLSYSSLDVEGVFYDEESEQYPGYYGDAYADMNHNSFNVKVGAKWGGTIYFRPEVGYAFSKLPEEVDVLLVVPEHGTSENETAELPISEFNNGLIFNLGIGLSF